MLAVSSFFVGLIELLELRAHHLAELLKAFHKLLVLPVTSHRLLGVGLEEVDCLHVLGIAEQLLHLAVLLHLSQKSICHPLLLRLLQIVPHLHCFLNLLNLKRIAFFSCLHLRHLSGVFGLRAGEKAFFEPGERGRRLLLLNVELNLFYFLVNAL